ncbi:Transcription initiation factor IIE subunit beta [Cichlidogyrus casuarinus]|uniref:Transcription initiation factor IIE subunit beta n=1 Tax=Cichlidogyrus casuarinus TaxID=1844966 RepID=A0ABD2Q9J4_9PLAT
MDKSLLRERELFLKRARALPVVERPNRQSPPHGNSSPASGPPSASASKHSVPSYMDLPSKQQFAGKFNLLSRIIKYMKNRHLEGDTHPLSVEEILEETMLTDTPKSIVKWLEDEALPNNVKILRINHKFVFRPLYKVRNRDELYALLRKHDVKGLGGIYLDDLMECLPDCENVLASLGDDALRIVNPTDKKTIIFFNDHSSELTADEVFKQYWRAISVEGMPEAKIEEYLQKQGIQSMSADKKKFTPAIKTKKGMRKRSERPVKIKDNLHMNDVLKEFKTD